MTPEPTPNLDEWLEVDPLTGEPVIYDEEPPPLPDPTAADRALARLARLERLTAEDIDTATRQVAQVADWLERRTGLPVNLTLRVKALDDLDPEKGEAARGGYAARMVWHRQQLEGYHRAVLAADSKRVTIGLPSGDLTSNAGQPTWIVTDAEKLLEWAREHKPAIIAPPPPPPEPTIDRAAMKKALTARDEKDKPIARGVDPETMEAVPGLRVEPAVRTFKPKPRKAGDS